MLEDPGTLKIGQNIKYDALVLSKYGIDVAPVDDTMLLSYVLDGGLHGHGMDELAELHLGHTTIKYKDVAGTGKAQVTFDHVPLDKAADYAAEDADITLRLHRVFKPRLLAESMVTVYETIERPLIPVLTGMERAGVRVDPEALRALSRDFTQRMAGFEDEIRELAGEDFNIASPKQLGEILFDKLGLDGGRKGKTGAYATGADVLEDLAAQGHDLPARVLDWRQLAKLKSTYSDTLVEQITGLEAEFLESTQDLATEDRTAVRNAAINEGTWFAAERRAFGIALAAAANAELGADSDLLATTTASWVGIFAGRNVESTRLAAAGVALDVAETLLSIIPGA